MQIIGLTFPKDKAEVKTEPEKKADSVSKPEDILEVKTKPKKK